MLFSACLLLASAAYAAPQSETGPCSQVPHADHPKAMLSNGDTQVLLFLPDTKSGYYRASRFDWSGVVACASYNGHTYFGEWFKRYDPLLNDAITGPVEEFRSDDGAIGYAAAAPGGLFVKPGVGVLRKIDNAPYKFGMTYPLVDPGTWSVHVKRRSVVFQQKLQGPNGIAYVYTKTVSIEKHGSTITLQHSLRNTGSAAIRTDVYDHDFFMLDGKPTGPGMAIHFPFEPVLDLSHDANVGTTPAAKIEGKEVVYARELAPGETFSSYLTGYGATAADYDMTVQDRSTGAGVEQTSDQPISRLYLWSIHTTICPEAYIHLDVAPATAKEWMIRYRLFGPPAAKATVAAAPAPLPS
jgi:hypothetical protein